MVQEHTSPIPVPRWGRRLSDAVREAVTGDDWSAASRLALRGDGQTRDLAREYALMVRGLGFTLEVLLGLLARAERELDPQAPGVQAATLADPDAARADLRALRRRLLDALGAADAGAPTAPAPTAADTPWVEACTEALRHSQLLFTADQHKRASAIVGALQAQDAPSALALLDAKDEAYLALHDPLVRFMADSFAWVLRHQGPRGLLDFHLATAQGQRTGFEKWEQMTAAEFAATTAFLLQQHMGQVQVLEDAQRFTIHQSPCGSGGRLQLNGAYAAVAGEPAAPALPVVAGPSALTFGEACTPVYCTHCAIWNGTATLRWFGRAQWVFERPARADGSCTLHIYKRREDAPADYSRRVAHPASEDRA